MNTTTELTDEQIYEDAIATGIPGSDATVIAFGRAIEARLLAAPAQSVQPKEAGQARELPPLDTPEFRAVLKAHERASEAASIWHPETIAAADSARAALISYIENYARAATPAQSLQLKETRELPPLPAPTRRHYGLHYSAEDMESYARASQAAPSVPNNLIHALQVARGALVYIEAFPTATKAHECAINAVKLIDAAIAAAPAAQAPVGKSVVQQCQYCFTFNGHAPDCGVLGTTISIDGQALETSKQAPDAKDAGWISVKDRLPEPGKYFLAINMRMNYPECVVAQRKGIRDDGVFVAGYYYMGQYIGTFAPTHWMPLPPAPSAAMQENGNTGSEE